MSADADYLRAARKITDKVLPLVTKLAEAGAPEEIPAIFRLAADAIDAEDEFRLAWLYGGPMVQPKLTATVIDPAGFDTLVLHDNGEHDRCHPEGCDDAPRDD